MHRGPDQQGCYESRCVSLGVTRLRIVDLNSAEQPMFSGNEDTVLLFNGEIYNHQELRRTLESHGHRFTSRSDTEVVLRAFLQWDKHCLARFRGMFALAIWTESRRRLLLARDRIGIKPLYLHRSGNDLYFASEIKALFEHPQVERIIDQQALEHYLALNYVPSPRTLLEGIEKLRPGHVLEWVDGKTHEESYWHLRPTRIQSRRTEDVQEELHSLLYESVSEQLTCDVPIGLWLSGGLDSSTVLHYARNIHPGRFQTFSIAFRGRSFDETAYIRQVAQKYGTDHHELNLEPDGRLASVTEKLIQHLDEPLADAGAIPIWFLSELTRKHATVVLSGEGADELFGGYLTYQADRLSSLARRLPHPMRRGLLKLSYAWPVSDEKIGFDYKLKRFLEGTLLPPDQAHTYWNGSFSDDQQTRLLQRKSGARVADLFEGELPPASEHALDRYMAFDQRYYLVDDILHKVDSMSMAHSIEARPPFLDHRIVEFAAGLPRHLKVDGFRQKVLLRLLMRNRLPGAILHRPKIGLDIPTHDWLRGALRPLLLDTLTTDAIKETGLFRQEAIGLLIHDHLARRANVGFHLWALLVLFLWIKQWKIQTTPRRVSIREVPENLLTVMRERSKCRV